MNQFKTYDVDDSYPDIGFKHWHPSLMQEQWFEVNQFETYDIDDSDPKIGFKHWHPNLMHEQW